MRIKRCTNCDEGKVGEAECRWQHQGSAPYKKIKNNMVCSRLEHQELQEEVAAPLVRLLTAATEENKVKKWW